jgi:hypothetical protein
MMGRTSRSTRVSASRYRTADAATGAAVTILKGEPLQGWIA